jgi:hypothetical protein
LKSSAQSGDREARQLAQIGKGQSVPNPLRKQSKYLATGNPAFIAETKTVATSRAIITTLSFTSFSPLYSWVLTLWAVVNTLVFFIGRYFRRTLVR